MSKPFSEYRVLVVDDEENIRTILEAGFMAQGATVFTAANANQGLDLVREENLDLVVSDIRMPGMDGLEFLSKVKEEQPWLPVLLITAHGTMDTAIQAMRLGAGDFLTKPFDLKHLREVALGLIARSQKPTSRVSHLDGVVGESPSFRQATEIALKAAKADSSILVLGESGTGKEVMAKLIHRQSQRSQGPLIAVNCGAIPENLMESELFGYEKGAFTGALHEKPGKIEMAQGGTLFLDEIGEMPLQLQVKLLRVLQERVVDRVGATQSRKVDFRLVAATNRDLRQEISLGKFREDLFYRIHVVPIQLPPLRERGEDILRLAEYFLQALNERYGTQHQLNAELRQQLMQYAWPGNIRELENTLERAVVLSDAQNLKLDLPELNALPTTNSPLLNLVNQAEMTSIRDALEAHKWNKTNTAKALGISRRSLLYKVKAYGIG